MKKSIISAIEVVALLLTIAPSSQAALVNVFFDDGAAIGVVVLVPCIECEDDCIAARDRAILADRCGRRLRRPDLDRGCRGDQRCAGLVDRGWCVRLVEPPVRHHYAGGVDGAGAAQPAAAEALAG